MARNVHREVYGKDSNGGSFILEKEDITSRDSGRKNGKLLLEPQMYDLFHGRVIGYKAPSGSPILQVYGDANRQIVPLSSTSCDNAAASRFYSKLRQGRASLGVTAASWKESSKMIQDRLKKTSSIFDGAYSKARRRGGRYTTKSLANDVLEGEFGWVPLIQDVHTAATSMFGEAIPPVHVIGRFKETISESRSQEGVPYYKFDISGRRSCTVDAFVYVSNPNLWALNRMGLINPAVVAWDLVPWSFLVNFFVNVPAVLGQFTDTIGLSISKQSTTRTVKYLVNAEGRWPDEYMRPPSESRTNFKVKRREVGTIPTITFEARVPDVSWETTMIAASLLTQKVRRFQNLFRI